MEPPLPTSQPPVKEMTFDETRTYSVNTKNAVAINGTQKSQASFLLSGLSSIGQSTQCSLKVLSASIPNLFYNIPKDRIILQYFNETISPFLYYIDIPAGFYDIWSLVTYLNEQLTVSEGVSFNTIISFTFNPYSNKVSISFNDPADGSIFFVNSSTLIALGSFQLQSFVLITGETVCGFYLDGSRTPQISIGMPKMTGVTNVIFSSPQLSTLNYSAEIQSSFVVNVPLTSDFGFTTSYQFQDNKPMFLSPSSLSDRVELSATDQNGALLDFNGNDWALIFQITYYRSVSQSGETLSEVLRRLVTQSAVVEEERLRNPDMISFGNLESIASQSNPEL